MTKEMQKMLKGVGGALAVLVAGLIYWFCFREPVEDVLIIGESLQESEILQESSVEEQWIYVHVSGAVKNPDQVYRLQEGSRVQDAIRMAGGCTDDADVSGLNLAQKISDGQKIYVPREGEEYTIEENLQESVKNHLTDLNKADKIELDALPGIGPALAQRIIEYREENGPFTEITQLKEVKGIGDALFEKLQDKITAG